MSDFEIKLPPRKNFVAKLNHFDLEDSFSLPFNDNVFNKHLIDNAICVFLRGSVVYGTVTENTKDIDAVVIVDAEHEHYIDVLGVNGILRFVDGNFDYQILTTKKFMELLDNHDVMAVEAMITPECFVIKGSLEPFREYFKLDKWKLRRSFCKVASNSWVKCKKKLTVEKDYDSYIAKKSMFHALRILVLGKRIAENYGNGYISMRDEQIDAIFRSVMECDPDWNLMYAKFHNTYNKLHSALVELCPKPITSDTDEQKENS